MRYALKCTCTGGIRVVAMHVHVPEGWGVGGRGGGGGLVAIHVLEGVAATMYIHVHTCTGGVRVVHTVLSMFVYQRGRGGGSSYTCTCTRRGSSCVCT